VQQHNIQQVNEALNGLYIEQEDYENLSKSIEDYNNLDQIGLASTLEKHELLEMRRIAAKLYKLNKRYKQSIELSKQDKIFKDAMVTARDSNSAELAESLLDYFIEAKDKECFTAMLFTCYELLKADVVLEKAWRNNMMDAAMPFVIQSVKQYTGKIDLLDVKEQKKEKEAEKKESAMNDFVPDYNPQMGMPGFGNLAIGNVPGAGMAPGMGGMGGGMGMGGMPGQMQGF